MQFQLTKVSLAKFIDNELSITKKCAFPQTKNAIVYLRHLYLVLINFLQLNDVIN